MTRPGLRAQQECYTAMWYVLNWHWTRLALASTGLFLSGIEISVKEQSYVWLCIYLVLTQIKTHFDVSSDEGRALYPAAGGQWSPRHPSLPYPAITSPISVRGNHIITTDWQLAACADRRVLSRDCELDKCQAATGHGDTERESQLKWINFYIRLVVYDFTVCKAPEHSRKQIIILFTQWNPKSSLEISLVWSFMKLYI